MRTEDSEVNKGVQVVRHPVIGSKLFPGVYLMGSNSRLLFESPFPFFPLSIEIGVYWRNWCSKSAGSNVFSADGTRKILAKR
jgi:hypothetical protein